MKDSPSPHHHSEASSCSKCGSSRHSDDHNVDKDERRPKGVKVFKPVITHFTAALNFKNYCLQMRSSEYNSHISGKMPTWAKRMNVQMKITMF